MKTIIAVIFFFISFLCGYAQKIHVIVPGQVVEQNAFQIQYVITDPSSLETISTPQFEDLQLISGPNYYKGNASSNGKTQPIENITYTVVPLKTGTIRINPVIARFKNGEDEKTDGITVTVVPQPKASFNARSTYTDINLYAPSSKTDLDKLIEDNLFIKTVVDKNVCFLGEAITATFKLYSRLQSVSEVIKAPGLYGFSVMDMLDINEAHQAVETINGKVFNTSVLRKLQLYPAQTGKLSIDEMQLQNTIEFNDSATGKKIKVEKLLASAPINIEVKPLPFRQPAGYGGAVGAFAISADLQNSKIAATAQGRLVITIHGKGNFIQFGPPAIHWPKEFDVFDPVVSDELNRSVIPAEGSRKYAFSFTSDRVGKYTIDPVSFSFFDPFSGKYKEAGTDSLRVEVIAAPVSENSKGDFKKKTSSDSWIYFAVMIALAVAALLFWRKRKQPTIQSPPEEKPSCLQRLAILVSKRLTGKQFCAEIEKLLVEVNKQCNLTIEQKKELQLLQSNCQLLIYSNINTEEKRNELQKRAELLLKQIGA